jgi:TRAP-type uncharacterized transport system substrate-binding protein
MAEQSMNTKSQVRRKIWRWAAPFLGCAALLLTVYLYFHTPKERTYRLTITAGNAVDTRHELAELLRKEMAAQGVLLQLHNTIGSEQALDQVNSGSIDLALVQGGLAVEDRPHVRQVVALHIEPLHLLVKKGLHEAVSKHLGALAGKTVDTGTVGSGTHTLAVKVLEFAGVRTDDPSHGGYIPQIMSREQLMAEREPAKLPDAIFLVSSLPSHVARHLVTNHGYELVPLPFGEAFALAGLDPAESASTQHAPSHAIDQRRTFPVMIPAFTYSVEPPVPAEALPSLGNRLLLVAHDKIDAQAVRRLVEVSYSTEFTKAARSALESKLLETAPEFPWHAGTILFRQQNQPLVSKDVMEISHKSMAILAAGASGLFVLWQWLRLRNQSARFEQLKRYLGEINRIEEQARQLERNTPLDLRDLLDLQHKVDRLKTEALEQMTEGRIDGKELLGPFFAYVDRTRDFLTRLISERRANLATPSQPVWSTDRAPADEAVHATDLPFSTPRQDPRCS